MAAPKKPKEPAKVGRPTKYTPELALRICRCIASSVDSISKICLRNPDFPVREVIWEWRLDNPEFSHMYDNAKRAQADLLAEDILAISDDCSNDAIINESTGREIMNSEYVARSRLRIDARKWIACKLLPKVYGDKIQQDEDKQDFKEALEAIKEIAKKCMKPV